MDDVTEETNHFPTSQLRICIVSCWNFESTWHSLSAFHLFAGHTHSQSHQWPTMALYRLRINKTKEIHSVSMDFNLGRRQHNPFVCVCAFVCVCRCHHHSHRAAKVKIHAGDVWQSLAAPAAIENSRPRKIDNMHNGIERNRAFAYNTHKRTNYKLEFNGAKLIETPHLIFHVHHNFASRNIISLCALEGLLALAMQKQHRHFQCIAKRMSWFILYMYILLCPIQAGANDTTNTCVTF